MVILMLVVASVGLVCKAFLHSGLCSVDVHGLHILAHALHHPSRHKQGIVTVSNHISTLDDPLTWGILPPRYYFSSSTTRWSLGASDILFTNPIFASFFSLGQTLETFRGKGIYQEAVDTAIEKVNQGQWVHLYGEGKVVQPNHYSRDPQGRLCIPRFKWGVGRILMEAKVPPVVIPMWITGFDQLMPEGRPFPYKYIPRIGAKLSVTFGNPVPADELRQALAVSPDDPDVIASAVAGSEHLAGWLGDDWKRKHLHHTIQKEHLYTSLVRQKVTAIIHRDVQALGRSVSDRRLGGGDPS